MKNCKPENIFIAPPGQYKSGEFREARHRPYVYSYSSKGTYAPDVVLQQGIRSAGRSLFAWNCTVSVDEPQQRSILRENASDTLSEDQIKEIVSMISVDDFTLDKAEDVQNGDVVTMSFTPNDELQNLTGSRGLELKFSKISKAFQN